jgi:hypothetical protein
MPCNTAIAYYSGSSFYSRISGETNILYALGAVDFDKFEIALRR